MVSAVKPQTQPIGIETTLYSYEWLVIDLKNHSKPPYKMEFISNRFSVGAGAIGQFSNRYPSLQVIRHQGFQQIGTPITA